MRRERHLFTSESVAMGHPDKVADQVSDAILDAIIADDPDARVAVETLVTTGLVFCAGEVTTTAFADIPEVARQAIKEIGYTDPKMGFDYESCAVITSIHEQSPDISQGVTEGEGLHKEMGAGDQGIMFGFACDETPQYMPMPIMLSHQLMENLSEERLNGNIPWLRPDGKSQVTVEYDGHRPLKVHTVVLSAQHTEDVTYDQIYKDIVEKVVNKTIPEEYMDSDTIYHINPTGKFCIGGPTGDTGLTGRKIIVDTYGGEGHHGGGAFSGKDPSKVDRSASYAARHCAKNIVASGMADRCEVQLAYAIGVAEPVSMFIDCFGTEKIPPEKIMEIVQKHLDFRPRAMIERLKLQRPIFRETARHGHFGWSGDGYTWEELDMVDAFRKDAGL